MGDMAEFLLAGMFDDPDESNVFYDNRTEEPYYPTKLDVGPGKCPICGGSTKLILGKYGQFYGCLNFPKCKGSRKHK